MALGIILYVIVWVLIFAGYRRKLMRFIISVEEMARRKEDFSEKISNIEASRIEAVSHLEKMRQEIKKIEGQRIELQKKINGLEMMAIPSGSLHMGSNSQN